MNRKDVFIENLFRASGAAGLTKQNLYRSLRCVEDVDSLVYMISKSIEQHGKEWLTCDYLFLEEQKNKFWTEWHHIDESHSNDWGFHKNQTGCYVYGLFKEKPIGVADPLGENVFYIGESRSTTRSAMMGRRGDFKSSVRNNPLAPYGIGIMFKKHFQKEDFDYVYQAYYPTPAYLCKEKETEFLVNYFKKYGNLPVCNHESDYNRIQKLSTNLTNFI